MRELCRGSKFVGGSRHRFFLLSGMVALALVSCAKPGSAGAGESSGAAQKSEDLTTEDQSSSQASADSKKHPSSVTPSGSTEVDSGDSPDQDSGESSSGAGNEEPEDSAKFDLGVMPEDGDKDPGIRPCEIDFLFVVDNSGSMGIKQENLSNSVPKFIDAMMSGTKMEKDYHIGVVTTDESPGNVPDCAFTGGLIVQTQNFDEVRMCGPYESGKSYMTALDDVDKSFKCAAKPGISGNTEEKPIDAIRGAIAPENAMKGRCNENFLRKDGLLVVVLITDEDDRFDLGGSKGSPKKWHAELLAAKGGDEKKLLVVSIVVPPKPNDCKPGDLIAKETKRLNEFTRLFGERGLVADVCSDSYAPIFDQAVGMIEFACGELHPPPE